jgi:hypothetical protein
VQLSSESRSAKARKPVRSAPNVVPHPTAWLAPDRLRTGTAEGRTCTMEAQHGSISRPHPGRADAEMDQLLRDLSWFSERAAELTAPATESEQRLLSRYLQLIAQRRSRLLNCRWASLLQSGHCRGNKQHKHGKE